MNWNEFNHTAVHNENPEIVELDLRPFGTQQSEALDFWLDATLTQGDPFGKRTIVITDASVILSDSARRCLTDLQHKGVSVSVAGRR